MTGLQTLLEDAAEHPHEVDVDADLRRARRALRGRRTRWAAAGATCGLVAVGAAGYTAFPRHHEDRIVVRPEAPPTSAPPVQTKYYDIPAPPAGWHVAAERPQYVMLGRDGTESTRDVFTGQLVVMLADGREHFDVGPSVEHDGRRFFVNDRNADATILSVRAPDGDWLQAQYPKGAFTDREMIVFLDGVVQPGARAGLG